MTCHWTDAHNSAVNMVMSIDRPQFKDRYKVLPNWRCSRCSIGSLVEDKAQRILLEPSFSKEVHSEDWWEPEHITNRFAAVLQCGNAGCGEITIVTGNAFVDYVHDYDGTPEYFDEFQPLTSQPPIAVFGLDDRWPEAVRTQLKLAFSHVFIDPGAAANRLRTAVECLMDERGVKKYPRTGPRKAINLHDRILDFKSQNAEAADLLLAVKWLGNTGSHADVTGLTREDLLDAMELLERALHLIYDDTAKRLTKLAQQINRKKGPARRR